MRKHTIMYSKSDGDNRKCAYLMKVFLLCDYCLLSGKPGDSLAVKRKPEKLIQLKRKVCTDVLIFVLHDRETDWS